MQLHCGARLLDLGRPRIMAVLNVTPDSFSDGGQFFAERRLELSRVVDAAAAMVAAGADIIDVGGESTRPGAEPVSVNEESARVLPVIEALGDLNTTISLDTSKPEVAQAGIRLGCHIVNDVRGLQDPGMVSVAAESDVGVCIMHMLGSPQSMQASPRYGNVVTEIRDFFQCQVHTCMQAGIAPERLMLDPGFGFGKTLEHNLALLRELESLRVAGLPLLVGLSRKSMLGALTDREVGERRVASAVAAALAVERGANVVRVHDVDATRDALRIVLALRNVQ